MEALVHQRRGEGWSEAVIDREVKATLGNLRPWRLSDAKLRARMMSVAKHRARFARKVTTECRQPLSPSSIRTRPLKDSADSKNLFQASSI